MEIRCQLVLGCGRGVDLGSSPLQVGERPLPLGEFVGMELELRFARIGFAPRRPQRVVGRFELSGSRLDFFDPQLESPLVLGDRAGAAFEGGLAVLGRLTLLALRQRQEPVALGTQHTSASPEPALVVLEALLFLAKLLLAAADGLGAVAQALLQLFDLGQPLGVGRPVAGLRPLRFRICAPPRHARSTVNDFEPKAAP